MLSVFLFLLFLRQMGGQLDEEEEGCEESLSRCTVRMACGMALHNYRISCRPELYGRVRDCSQKCQQATISLATTSEGYDYLHCDCGLNLFCHTLRNRTSSCWTSGGLQDDKDNASSGAETSCRVAEWMCTADETCAVAWDYFRQLCRSLFAGLECSRRCNNSLSILMRQRNAQALHGCVCDGPDADVCFQERTNIRRLCYGLKDTGLSSAIIPAGTALILGSLGLIIFTTSFRCGLLP